MPLFRYTVVDKSGRALNGVMQAIDEADLARRLSSSGYTVQTVALAAGPVAQAAAPQSTARAATPAGLIPPSLEPRIPLRTLAVFLRQMAVLVRSGLAPYQAIQEVLTRTRSGRLKRALLSMEAQVRGGGAMSPAMRERPDVFPARIVGLIYCGELGGFLDTALDEAATSIEQEAKQRLWPRIVYGFIRLNIISGFATLPAVRADVWMDKIVNADMSVPERLAYLRDFYMRGLLRVALPLTVVFLAATYIWPHVKRIPSVRSALDRVILKAPIWGALHRGRSLASFSRWLARLYAAGVSPSPAWVAASYTCANSVLSNSLRSVGASMASGGTVTEALTESRVFDADTAAVIMAGEKAGDIPGVLQNVADFNDGIVAAQHAYGRWISTSMTITSLLIMGGILFLMFWAGYAKVLQRFMDQAGG